MIQSDNSYQKQYLVILVLFLSIFSQTIVAQDNYINARNFAESNEIAYQWFPIQKKLVMRKGLKAAHFTVDDYIAIVDGNKIKMTGAPKIQNGQIMIPSLEVNRFFNISSPKAPTLQNDSYTTLPRNTETEKQTNLIPDILTQKNSITQTPAPNTSKNEIDDAIMIALRHSTREDHTRVVLEFNNDITYKTELKDNTFRLIILDCRNLVPANRTNPIGKAISKMDINSGANRRGLIIGFKLLQSKKHPVIETIRHPFRMIISFPFPDTPAIDITNKIIKPKVENIASTPVKQVIFDTAPEINIEVLEEKLASDNFHGRIVVIDPGHGGNDYGFVFEGRPPEKDITLEIAKHLKFFLQKAGLEAVLTRTSDIDMSQSQRMSFANKLGTDLYISLHIGGSTDTSKAGAASYYYSKLGTSINEKAQDLSSEAIYNEWIKNSRFDLSAFLSQKINDRMIKHLTTENRGSYELPLLPLKYIINPAILVEVGMLSDQTEGKNLISDNYRKAVAQSVANGVIDFFNGIIVNP